MNIHISKYGSGYSLVFFHGWGFDSKIWGSLVPRLMGNYQLILVDLPGFGQSPMMEWVLFKDQLLQQLPEHFAVVGWSMGGLYATRLSLEEPHRVNYLLNITSSPYFLLDNSWPGVSRQVFEQFYQKLMHAPQVTLNEFIELQAKNKFQPPLEYLPSSEGLEFGLEILENWDLRSQLKFISQPVCYMFGRLDPIVPIKTMHVMQEIYPDFDYVFFNRAATYSLVCFT